MHLGRAPALRYHEICADGVVYTAEVRHHYIVAFFILQAIDDGIE